MDKRFVLALFVVAAIAAGLITILLLGINKVDEDGRENDAPPIGGVPASTVA